MSGIMRRNWRRWRSRSEEGADGIEGSKERSHPEIQGTQSRARRVCGSVYGKRTGLGRFVAESGCREERHVVRPAQRGSSGQVAPGEWNADGEGAFQYEILEKLEDDVHPLAVADRLKEMRSRWIAQLGARGL